MAQHARLISGRLLIARHSRPWHAWPADELLDVCDTLREDELRWLVSLKADVRLSPLPEMDVRRIPVRSSVGFGFIHYDPPGLEDDGTWGMDEESWEPSSDAESG